MRPLVNLSEGSFSGHYGRKLRRHMSEKYNSSQRARTKLYKLKRDLFSLIEKVYCCRRAIGFCRRKRNKNRA